MGEQVNADHFAGGAKLTDRDLAQRLNRANTMTETLGFADYNGGNIANGPMFVMGIIVQSQHRVTAAGWLAFLSASGRSDPAAWTAGTATVKVRVNGVVKASIPIVAPGDASHVHGVGLKFDPEQFPVVAGDILDCVYDMVGYGAGFPNIFGNVGIEYKR